MVFNARLYPPDWNTERKEKIAAAGGCCQGDNCGAPDRSIQQNAKGSPYMVHLSIAHKNQYETWKHDAETMVLCQACHRRYDRRFRRKSGTRRYHSPLGYASVYVAHEGSMVLVEMPRTLDELRDVVSALPAKADIEVQFVMLLAVVGNARYHKKMDGSLRVLMEFGPCSGLAAQLGPVSASPVSSLANTESR